MTGGIAVPVEIRPNSPIGRKLLQNQRGAPERRTDVAIEFKRKGKSVLPEIIIPLVGVVEELIIIKKRAIQIAGECMAKAKMKVEYQIGRMIELPRADKIAEGAEFFSFGANDLTQMAFGFSSDDIKGFTPTTGRANGVAARSACRSLGWRRPSRRWGKRRRGISKAGTRNSALPPLRIFDRKYGEAAFLKPGPSRSAPMMGSPNHDRIPRRTCP